MEVQLFQPEMVTSFIMPLHCRLVNPTLLFTEILSIKENLQIFSPQQIRQSSKESTGSSDTDSSSEDESTAVAVPVPTAGIIQPDKVAQTKETEAGAEISALVNYVQPVHFSSFENSESN